MITYWSVYSIFGDFGIKSLLPTPSATALAVKRNSAKEKLNVQALAEAKIVCVRLLLCFCFAVVMVAMRNWSATEAKVAPERAEARVGTTRTAMTKPGTVISDPSGAAAHR